MDLSNIKLVVFDMDGTLLNSKGEVSNQFFALFKKLQQKNIHFTAASGRQYYSIIKKLSPIKDQITVIAENGGITKQNGKELNTFLLDPETVKTIIKNLRSIENAEIVLCGKKQAYVESTDKDFIAFFNEFYTHYKEVEDLTAVKEDDFFKLAVFHKENSEKYIYPYIKHWEDQHQVKVSGKHWVDLSHKDSHKGNALKSLQEYLGISKAETIVFGDYNNDLEMLTRAHYSFAMENAHPNVKKEAQYSTKSNDENGVEFILEKLLSQIQNN